ncbi:hydrogenase expression/synthesis HypA [Dethiosulfovibrio peptidovorans DSM 11002]|uniref:Hydrogenase maturation factor HypA n=2 Tax=Dethiosulfovibrio TaxID=47054 RepID=D2Z4S2_9BACT|nr:hydrogenase expression/synthesis HypA [Dethiosulfovibrio peptidovorans DSM 11002]
MHEMSLVSAILESLEKMVDENGWSSVKSVTLRVGAMRQVIPDVMKFAFDVSVKGTPMEGAELAIISVPIKFSCRGCGAHWGEEELGYLCPFCGGTNVDMDQGMELELESLEVQER